MFPFWGIAIAPVLAAAGARRVVEIGALRGDNTRRIIDHLGPDAELHVIDPDPGFDPSEHRARFGGRYVFHRDLSINVLGQLPPMDAALIDGDHNWYTVSNELRLLREVARAADAPLPVLVLHDVSWPYGRRDLYYAPDTIPAEHRQPHRRAGMRPGNPGLLDEGGMSAGHWNAEVEGGPRNGVMTALDDFMASHDRPLRRVVLPLYFGLAIVVEEERLARQPALAAELDRLESPAGKDALIEMGEEIRLRAVAHNHTLIGRRDARIGRLAARYLDGVVRALVDEHYLENEVRIDHLLDCATNGRQPNLDLLRDPVRHASVAFENLRQRRRTGAPWTGSAELDRYVLAPAGRLALDQIAADLDRIRQEGVAGDLAVCGVGRGGTGVFLRAYLEAHDVDDRELWLADRFTAGDTTDLNGIRDAFDRFDLLDDRTHFLQGDLGATLPDAPPERLALLVVGELPAPDVETALEHLVPRLAEGGVVVVGDTSDPAVARALDVARSRRTPAGPARRFGLTGSTWAVTGPAAPSPGAATAPSTGAPRVPLARPAADPVDLSVVIVFYNMRREAARSLHALSRAYQRGIEDLDYEVVVVENGSAPDQRLGEDYVASFGPEFRYLDLGERAQPSPAFALNEGIRASRGDAVALMVDGAHVLTPGVLHYGMTGLATYAPAIVGTQPWYTGPGQQGEAMRSGYDQAYEDQLFDQVAWPEDGYRLFDIGHFQGDRDWLDGLWESNCLFVGRKQLEQVGGYDEGFAMAGGGYTNLDLYERLGASPDIQIVTILGEGSFHQVHGGTTTNQSDPVERRSRVHSYAEHYAELRGRPFIGPEKPVRYVGAFEANSAKRARARRMTALAFDVDRRLEGADGPTDKPVPVPDELRDSFIAAYWRSLAWRDTAWLGHQVNTAATDLVTYQEILTDVRPDWIVLTGTRAGGRAMFFASICDALGHGRVVSVDPVEDTDRPTHPRVTHLVGSVVRDEVRDQVRSLVGPDPRALVVLGTRGKRNRVEAEFEALAPLVALDSYAIIEHTILNGRPVDASFGAGPFEAMRRILLRHGEFIVDNEREKQSLTFNPMGFLRRIR